jgi:hypothetical protein
MCTVKRKFIFVPADPTTAAYTGHMVHGASRLLRPPLLQRGITPDAAHRRAHEPSLDRPVTEQATHTVVVPGNDDVDDVQV